jgi:hypothetical protein
MKEIYDKKTQNNGIRCFRDKYLKLDLSNTISDETHKVTKKQFKIPDSKRILNINVTLFLLRKLKTNLSTLVWFQQINQQLGTQQYRTLPIC